MNLTRSLDFPPSSSGIGEVQLRTMSMGDGEPVAAAYRKNANHLAPWEPTRDETFFTVRGQEQIIQGKLDQFASGREVPWVIVWAQQVIGMITLTGIVRGPFLNANLGYWVDEAHTGKGVASTAVRAVLSIARDELGLHRVQAATLVHNVASQAVLKRSGFEPIGVAPAYLHIAGKWQDHVLYQHILV